MLDHHKGMDLRLKNPCLLRQAAFVGGESCVRANRIYVQDSVAEPFLEKLRAAVAQLKLGCGTDDGVTRGPLIPFKDEDDVVAMANDTEYGLASYFYARDMARIWRAAEALKRGIVGVNTGCVSNEMTAFGGVKQSGLGREGSKFGIEDFLD